MKISPLEPCERFLTARIMLGLPVFPLVIWPRNIPLVISPLEPWPQWWSLAYPCSPWRSGRWRGAVRRWTAARRSGRQPRKRSRTKMFYYVNGLESECEKSSRKGQNRRNEGKILTNYVTPPWYKKSQKLEKKVTFLPVFLSCLPYRGRNKNRAETTLFFIFPFGISELK